MKPRKIATVWIFLKDNYELDIQLLFVEVNKLLIIKSIRIFITRYKNISITFSLFPSKNLFLFTKGGDPFDIVMRPRDFAVVSRVVGRAYLCCLRLS